MTKFLKLISAILICQSAGFIGSLFTTPNLGAWYQALAKPNFQPPNWLFGPVWITLYLLMGVSLYLIISPNKTKKSQHKFIRSAVILFSLQLLLNMVWPMLFFAGHEILPAAVELISLWTMLAATALTFYKLNKTAAWLLAPYLAWVTFAFILNSSIVWLNK